MVAHCAMSTFDPLKTCKHWPIIEAYRDGKLLRAQTESQLLDIGMVDWEIELYLDDILPDEE